MPVKAIDQRQQGKRKYQQAKGEAVGGLILQGLNMIKQGNGQYSGLTGDVAANN